MKKMFLILVVAIIFVVTGCQSGGISQEKYDKTAEEKVELKENEDSINNGSEINAEHNEDMGDEGNKSPSLQETDMTKDISVKEYSYDNGAWGTYYIMELTNNSKKTVSVETNVIAKDSSGKTIGAKSDSKHAIESGYSVCLFHIFEANDINSFSYTISANEDDYYEPALSDLSYEVSDTWEGIIITCTNKGDRPIEFVEGTVLFFSNGQVVDYDTNYFTDNDLELKPKNTLAKEFDYYKDVPYDDYKVYFTGRRRKS